MAIDLDCERESFLLVAEQQFAQILMVAVGLWVDLLLHHIIDRGGETSEVGTRLAVGIVGARTTRIELHILKA